MSSFLKFVKKAKSSIVVPTMYWESTWMADLEFIYRVATLDEAEYQLLDFGEKWNQKYPQIAKSWRENWTELSAYFKYPEEIRRIIYTANAVEGFHRMFYRFIKTKTSYPTNELLKKSIYLSIMEIGKKGIGQYGIGA
jgi:transposase-like protein